MAAYNSNMATKRNTIIGRKEEQKRLQAAIDSPNAELIAVYGRRRVGKTHLVSEFFSPRVDTFITVTGEKDANSGVQLYHFQKSLAAAFGEKATPVSTWRSAFEHLSTLVEEFPKKRVVVFLDELPWLATRRSGLLQAIDYYWNTRLSKLPKFSLVLCGSAAAWMLEKLIHAKGGLYNRITKRIHLLPFQLGEAQEFLTSRGVKLTYHQVLELYMAIGGVPHHLMQVERRWSAAQAVASICFDRNGILFDEYERLFDSLFNSSDVYDRLIQVIAQKRSGVSLNEIREHPDFSSGGRLTKRLSELEAAGFISEFIPWGKSNRDKAYRITDEFVWFYLSWIQNTPKNLLASGITKYWQSKVQTQAYRAWAGYSFEALCLKHAAQIREALGISGIATEAATWRVTAPKSTSKTEGAQIDLLFDRADGVINLCELKFSRDDFVITKAYSRQLKRKLEIFETHTKTKKQVFLSLVTTHGLKTNIWSEDLIHNVVTAQSLFAQFT